MSLFDRMMGHKKPNHGRVHYVPNERVHTHYVDVSTDKPYNDIRTCCGLFSQYVRRTLEVADVDCPECLASDEMKAALMEDALVTLIDSRSFPVPT